MKPFSKLFHPLRIALVLMGGFAVWQHFRIVALEESIAALRFTQASGVERETGTGTGPGPGPGAGLGLPGASASAGGGAGSALAGDRGPEAGTDGGNSRAARMRQLRSMDRAQRLEAKVLDLTSSLNLTTDQQSVVRAVLQSGSEERDAIRAAAMERRRGGQPESEAGRRAEFSKLNASESGEEEKIAAALSAEQLTEYSEYITRQKQDSLESRANQQLGDLQGRFTLTEEQKDAAFQFFARQEEQNAAMRADGAAASSTADPAKAFAERQKTRLEAMRKILTPAQFELLRQQEDQRAELFRTMSPADPPPPSASPAAPPEPGESGSPPPLPPP